MATRGFGTLAFWKLWKLWKLWPLFRRSGDFSAPIHSDTNASRELAWAKSGNNANAGHLEALGNQVYGVVIRAVWLVEKEPCRDVDLSHINSIVILNI